MGKKFILPALLLEGIWIVSLGFVPWKDNIFPFLGLFGAAFLVYVLACRSLLKKPLEPTVRPALFVAAAGIVFRVTVFFSPPSLSDDIYRYLWDGRVQLAGINPYLYPPEDPALAFLRDADFPGINHKPIRTLYPPLSQLVFRAGAAASPRLTTQRLIFAGFDAAMIFLLLLYLRRKDLPAERVLLYAWNPLILVEFSSSGHFDSLALFWLMAGLLAYDAGRPGLAGFRWGLAFLGKFASLVLVPWMVLKKSGRRALLFFIPCIAAGYAFFLQWPLWEVKKSLFSGAKVYAKDWFFNAGLYALLSALTPLSPQTIKISLAAAASVAAVVLIRKFRENQILAYAGILWALSLAASPVVHPWYAAGLVPFLCFFPLWSGILFSGLVALAYVVLFRYSRTGVWDLPLWVPWVEYGATYSLLAWEIWRERPLPGITSSAPVPCAAGIVIPALNEEKALPSVLSEIPRKKAPWVVVVDNGSTDGTAAAARAGGAEVVEETRKGYGWAVQTGIGRLPPACNVVVVMDGDHSDFPEDLPALLAPIESGRADFVIGSRVLGGAPPGSLTPQQRLGNFLSCFLMRLFFRRKFTDLGPFRAIRRETLENLAMRDGTFGWNVEMQIKAVRNGVRTVEIPVRYRPRIGVSKISGTLKGSALAGVKILWTIFKFGLWEMPKEEPVR